MKVAYNTKTNEYLNIFQSNATDEGLKMNAQNMGINSKDIEIREVDDAQFKQLFESINAEAIQDSKDLEAQMKIEAQQLQDKLKLSDREFQVLNYLLAQKG